MVIVRARGLAFVPVIWGLEFFRFGSWVEGAGLSSGVSICASDVRVGVSSFRNGGQ